KRSSSWSPSAPSICCENDYFKLEGQAPSCLKILGGQGRTGITARRPPRFGDHRPRLQPSLCRGLDLDRRADFDVIVEQFCSIRGHADTAVRSRIAGQNSDVHADTLIG